MRRTTPLALFGLAVTLAWAGPLSAQASTTRGFNLGVHASGASLTVEDQDRREAGGGGILIGYGVNRRLTLLVQLDGARFDDLQADDVEGDWVMGHADLGVRFHFANSLSRWIPFLQGTIGVRAVGVEDPVVNGTARETVSFTGGSLTLGGGIAYYLSEGFALEVAVLGTGGEFTTLQVDDVSISGFDIDATSGRLNLGISWWP